MSSCHETKEVKSCHKTKKRLDILFWGSVTVLAAAYLIHLLQWPQLEAIAPLSTFSLNAHDLINKMAWGIFLGIVFFGLLGNVPREFVMAILGKGGTLGGLVRATAAGVLLDLCSHGILLVGMKLYQKGASLGQTMAFLIASPWNSLSLTFILWALIGLKWTLVFLGLSMAIALISGLIFDRLVASKVLPENPNSFELPKNFSFFRDAKLQLAKVKWTISTPWEILKSGALGSKMVLRWIFFGIVLASLVRTFFSPETFATFFGPTLGGLGLTLLVATILEVCSEGSTPIAADLLTRAGAPGNSFAFLMTGVSTDYTEMLALKETTKSWKIALFLPLITLPQIILLALILNQATII
jgi:uncharacterized protein